MKTKLFTIAMMVALLLAAITRGQAQEYDGPCLPPTHGLDDHQSAFCGSTETQTIALSSGWNNISIYLEISDDDEAVAMLEQLEEALGDNALTIEGTGGVTQYEDEEWFGSLDNVGVTNEQSYVILVSTACTIELQGIPANPADHTITINPGWNYIGFPYSEEVDIEDALSEFEAEENDMIEGPGGYTTYEDEEWYGSLSTFVPGQGYKYLSNSDETKTLVIQTGGSKVRDKVVSPNKTKKPRLGLDDKQ